MEARAEEAAVRPIHLRRNLLSLEKGLSGLPNGLANLFIFDYSNSDENWRKNFLIFEQTLKALAKYLLP